MYLNLNIPRLLRIGYVQLTYLFVICRFVLNNDKSGKTLETNTNVEQLYCMEQNKVLVYILTK